MSAHDEAEDEREAGATGAVSRRRAVQLLGAAPVLAALQWHERDVERAARLVRALPAASAYAPAYFTEAEWRTVRLLVDYVIPRDARSGSATDAKVPEFMDFMLSDQLAAGNMVTMRTTMRTGLAWLDAECVRRFDRPFADCADAQRRQVLDAIAWPRRAHLPMADGVTFFTSFRDMTASGFFSSEMGWKDLQYMGHTFVPEWQGCPEPALRKLGVSYAVMQSRVPVEDRRG
ncbi:MAG TPA: gluconate 2-dehydrogenase subunit 3 family protein [Gemmatimonadaceae bacterium]|nr:gluconate 2-dehydrogenase subunit 3 family protein [Gemmatimonadaceae bacterium]